MKIPRPYSLQSKFILRLIWTIGLISIMNLTALYYFMQNTQNDEVSTRASIVLQQVDAVQNYVRRTLRPKMYQVMQDEFVLEAMSSSFISRSVMEKSGESEQDYVYRRVAINSRNTNFEANKIEKELISYFRNNQDQKLWQGNKMVEGRKLYVMARPVRFTSSCMHCHGDIDEAPIELIELYGEHGFNHEVDSIDGVDLVGIPTGRYATEGKSKFTLYVAIYMAISGLVLIFIYLTFQQVVVVNMRSLTSFFRKNFSDEKGVELIKKVEKGDEIEEMIEGMEGLSQHLYETKQQLKAYTVDLEKEVDRRTRQLKSENEVHRKDLSLFVNILRSLKDSRQRTELWANILPLIMERFNLKRIAYICTFSNNQVFSWPPGTKSPHLPKNYVDLLVHPRLHFIDNTVFVPVGSSDQSIEGLLFLEKTSGEPFAEEDNEMLTAVGRQLGIASENLAILDSIFKQTDNLRTIFEGLSDPVLLMESSGKVIVANKAAEDLEKELSAEEPQTEISEESQVVDRLLLLAGKPQTFQNQQTLSVGPGSMELILKNGRSFILKWFPLSQADTLADRVVVTLQEDTEKKKMVQQVVQAEKMATVGKLAAGLAHEMNNPLGVILCYAELLKKSLGKEQHQSDVDVVIKHTTQAQSVLQDLLNFARPKVSTDRDSAIGEVIESVITVFQVQAAKKGVALQCKRQDHGVLVRVEPQVVEHIILNLLINGLDAISESGGMIDVDISVCADKKFVILKVQDSGIGIDQEILPSIFDPFFTTKDVSKGTGLGLAVIYGYMRELGGTIEATNIQTGGALFELYFPIAQRNESIEM